MYENYKAPNPYVLGVPFTGNTGDSISLSTMGLVGVTPRGVTDKAVLVTSWLDFINKFAYGCASPFMVNSDLAFAVYGFFQNGGAQLYVARVVGAGAVASSIEIGQTNKAKLSAIEVGAWGNNLKVKITANATTNTNFDIEVTLNDEVVETLPNLSNTSTDATFYQSYINKYSQYLVADTGSNKNLVATEKTALTGGADDIANIGATQYQNALKLYGVVRNLIALGIAEGGNVADAVSELKSYTTGKRTMPVYDLLSDKFGTYNEFKTALTAFNAGDNSAVIVNSVKVSDPLNSGELRNITPIGHYMGVIARTIDLKGEWSAPAGVEAYIKGVVGVVDEFTDEQRGEINDLGANVLIDKPNYGTVVWGARTFSPSDKKMTYISNVIQDYTLQNIFDASMQKFEFKNITPDLWRDIVADITGTLETKRLQGAFYGETPETCYFVVCDYSNNTQQDIDNGRVIVDVGYANTSVAEFIIVRVAHQISN